MNKQIPSLALLCFALAILCSCGSTKNIPYFKNADQVDLSQSEYLYDARIMPKDILTITVNTSNPEAAAPFNLTVPSTYSPQGAVNWTSQTLQTYLVDNQGYIDYPVLGRIDVGGLTKSACEKMIRDKIKPYLNENENPVVTVRMSNYKISVLGEVASPGMFIVSNEKINILEALAQAGDLTIYGVRDRIRLIRENEKGRKEIHTLNLNDANLINSPYYYLQQNDIVYVEPNKVKSQNSSVGSVTNLWLSGTSILISLASLMYTILK